MLVVCAALYRGQRKDESVTTRPLQSFPMTDWVVENRPEKPQALGAQA